MQLTFLRLKLAELDIARAKSVPTTERFVCTNSEFFNADAKTRKKYAVNCWLVLKVFPPPNVLLCTSSEFFNADAKTRKNFSVNCWLVLKVFPPPNVLLCTSSEFFNAIVALECPFFANLF